MEAALEGLQTTLAFKATLVSVFRGGRHFGAMTCAPGMTTFLHHVGHFTPGLFLGFFFLGGGLQKAEMDDKVGVPQMASGLQEGGKE